MFDDDLDEDGRGLRWLPAGVLLLAVFGGGFDLWLDDSARSALEGLGRAMDERFDAWGLTPAELSAFLLEGVMLPAPARAPVPTH